MFFKVSESHSRSNYIIDCRYCIRKRACLRVRVHYAGDWIECGVRLFSRRSSGENFIGYADGNRFNGNARLDSGRAARHHLSEGPELTPKVCKDASRYSPAATNALESKQFR